jgi:hypothetical protein
LLDKSAVEVGHGKFWIEPDGLIKISNRSFELPLLSLGKSAVDVALDELWIEVDCLIKISDD